MTWITKLINKDSNTSKEALENATELIDSWCKENGFKYEILHNKDTDCNRVLYVKTPHKTYVYKFIISSYNKPTGEFKSSYNIFTESKCLHEITEPVYYAHLDR